MVNDYLLLSDSINLVNGGPKVAANHKQKSRRRLKQEHFGLAPGSTLNIAVHGRQALGFAYGRKLSVGFRAYFTFVSVVVPFVLAIGRRFGQLARGP